MVGQKMSSAHSVGSSHSYSHSFFFLIIILSFSHQGQKEWWARSHVNGQCSGTSVTVYPDLQGKLGLVVCLQSSSNLFSVVDSRSESKWDLSCQHINCFQVGRKSTLKVTSLYGVDEVGRFFHSSGNRTMTFQKLWGVRFFNTQPLFVTQIAS